jgi:hypothetical protein
MRNRPSLNKTAEQKFIENAQGGLSEAKIVKEDLHKYVKKAKWPLEEYSPSPSLAEGSNLKKPLLLYLNEQEWNSIDRHVKIIGTSKQEWFKYAFHKLLEEEQHYFFKNSVAQS